MGASSFNEMEIDAIGEIMNISLGASATAISTMLGAKVNITTPKVSIVTSSEFGFKNLEPAIGVEIAYTAGLDGSNVMMFRRNDVRIIVGMLMGDEIPEEDFELDEINLSAICEVMNQMMGSSATALSEFLGSPVNISTPVSFEIANEAEFKDKYFTPDASMIVVRFVLEIEGKLESEFLNIMSLELTKRLLAPFHLDIEEACGNGSGSAAAGEESRSVSQSQQAQPADPVQSQQTQPADPVQSQQTQPTDPAQPQQTQPTDPAQYPQTQPTDPAQPQQAQPTDPAQYPQPQPTDPAQPQQAQPADPVQSQQAQPAVQPQPAAYGKGDPMLAQLLVQMQQSQIQMMEMMREMKTKERPPKNTESSIIRPMNPAQLEQEREDGQEERTNQEMLMKVPLEVSVEIGRTKKLVRDILEFTQGSLVVLDKMAGEQADLYVNGQCIARGDIVVVEDNFGIRITEIIARDINPECL